MSDAATPLRGLPTAARAYDPDHGRTGMVLDVLAGVAYLEDVATGERWTHSASRIGRVDTGPEAA